MRRTLRTDDPPAQSKTHQTTKKVTDSRQLRQLKIAQFYQLFPRSHFLPLPSLHSFLQEKKKEREREECPGKEKVKLTRKGDNRRKERWFENMMNRMEEKRKDDGEGVQGSWTDEVDGEGEQRVDQGVMSEAWDELTDATNLTENPEEIEETWIEVKRRENEDARTKAARGDRQMILIFVKVDGSRTFL